MQIVVSTLGESRFRMLAMLYIVLLDTLDTVLPWKEGPFQLKNKGNLGSKYIYYFTGLIKIGLVTSPGNPAAFVKSPRAWGMWVTVWPLGKPKLGFQAKAWCQQLKQQNGSFVLFFFGSGWNGYFGKK